MSGVAALGRWGVGALGRWGGGACGQPLAAILSFRRTDAAVESEAVVLGTRRVTYLKLTFIGLGRGIFVVYYLGLEVTCLKSTCGGCAWHTFGQLVRATSDMP